MMKKIITIVFIFILTGLTQAGTWLPTGTLASNCAIYGITGTASGDVIIADYNSQLQKRQSGSNTWSPAGLNGKKVRYLTTLPNGDIFAISGTGLSTASCTTRIHRSTDNGATWEDVFSKVFPFNNIVGGAMTVKQDGSLFAALPVFKGPTLGDYAWSFTYQSTDGGNSWIAQDSTQVGEPRGLIPVGENKVLVGTTADGVYFKIPTQNFWFPIDTVPHFFGSRYTVDLIKSGEGTIFYTEGAKVRRSTDSGISTQILTTPSPSSVINAICAGSDNELYIATDDKKLYKSSTMGNTWELMRTGLPNAANVYSLKLIDGKLFAGTFAYGVYYYEQDIIGIGNENNFVSDFKLNQNYPNPFNPNTKISFSIPKSQFVSLKIFDMMGREVESLMNENKDAGNYNVNFDASAIAGGVYFYKIQTQEFSETKKMILVK